jgi:signal transduction histidine kinase
MSSGPAMTTLRSVIARLALTVRSVGIVYIVVQVSIWHKFYIAAPWRLVAPALAVAWGITVMVYLRKRWPSPFLACVDSAVYIALMLGAQVCIPSAVRDDPFSWLVISVSGQLIVPVWYASGGIFTVLALATPAAYWIGAMGQPVTDARTLTAAAFLLLVIAFVHVYGRREIYSRAVAADMALDGADRTASEQYATLHRDIERREHERLVHDTVLNTLTAIARADSDDVARMVDRCRQDVALIEIALGDPENPAHRAPGGPVTELESAAAGRAPGTHLPTEVRAVAGDMRARGLDVHVGIDDGGGLAVPNRVVVAIANAVREALSNVAQHAGTGEAWVRIQQAAPNGDPGTPRRLGVIVRDKGTGFDRAHVDQARLGLRRSIAERIADCGGRASIWSEPGQGTVVFISWPASGESAELARVGSAPGGLPW